MRFPSLVSLGFILAFNACAFSSCAKPKPSEVSFFAEDGSSAELTAGNDDSVSGFLPLAKDGKLRYSLKRPLTLAAYSALEIEYSYEGPEADRAVVFSLDSEPSWALPPDASFLGFTAAGKTTVRYRFPITGKVVSSFQLETKKIARTVTADLLPKDGPVPGLQLKSVRLAPRVYGYSISDNTLFLTPFVYFERGQDAIRFVVEPPANFPLAGGIGAYFLASSVPGKLSTGGQEYRYVGRANTQGDSLLSFPAAALPANPFPIAYESKSAPRSFIVERSRAVPFPEEPITADPGLILSYRREAWRDARYEVFRWECFPSILIFDTANYEVQERLFKRLAFFVEKAGYRGHLASDKDIAGLHGWNAHDYRAEDLAAFFESARKTKFPLNVEERELQRILVAAGLVRKVLVSDGTEAFVAGTGAVISISRESAEYLRTLFITHEGFHGIFFLDEEFRRFASERYAAFDAESKKFLKAYFDSRRYDVKDTYLMINELMAYCLQQPLDLISKYFGDTLPTRLEKDEWRKTMLPPRGTGILPYPTLSEAFTKTASDFDAYVASRWNMRAGRAALIYQISRTKAAR
ncbi:MAG: hypothetical protein WCT14_05270 [Treponemataceae bacterium]